MGNEKVAGARTIKASEFKAKCLKLMDEGVFGGRMGVVCVVYAGIVGTS